MRRFVLVGMMGALFLVLGAGCTYISCDWEKCRGTKGPDYIEGQQGEDYKLIAYAGCDAVFGRSGNDKLYGDRNDDSVIGNQGDDLLSGGSGNDYVADGDTGRSAPPQEIEDCVTDGSGFGPGGGGLESLEASDTVGPNDTPVEELRVQEGRDKLYGNSGNDTLDATDGQADRVNCGPGRDTAFFDEGIDTVVGCEIKNPPQNT